MGRTLVTGATGCLGSNLVTRLLQDGEDLAILKRQGDPLGNIARHHGRFEVRHGDTRDLDSVRRAMRGVEAVYHLAGVTVPLNRLERLMWDVNVAGTHNVMRAAAASAVTRVVHTSSVAAIGYPPDSTVAAEAFDNRDSVANNAYSRTKRAGEEVARRFNGGDLEVVVVNPSGVIAPGGDLRFSWAAIVHAAQRRRLRFFPPGGSALCARNDLVEGLMLAMRRGRPGERYILSTRNLPYAELGALVAEAVGVAPPRWRAPRGLLRWLGRANQLVGSLSPNPYVTGVLVPENVELMGRRLYYDQAKAVQELGLPQTSLLASLREIFEWSRTGGRYAGEIV